MKSFCARCLTVVVAILVLATVAACGSSVTPTAREAVGANFDCVGASPADLSLVLGSLGAAHVRWLRLYVHWDKLEPTQPRRASRVTRSDFDRRYLAGFRACVERAHESGLKVLVDFVDNPLWQDSAWNDPPNRADYAATLGYLAGRFPQVSAWEVWNEENTSRYWHGTARRYVGLLQASYRAVKQANPAALVVFGGTEHNDAEWVRACYRAGARGYFDVLATHPYPRNRSSGNLGSVLGSVSSVRRVMLAYGDSRTPVWFTEFGWSRSAVEPGEQARLLRGALAYIASELPYVRAAFWYQAKNEYAGADQWLRGTSLLSATGTATPALLALAAWNGTASP